MPMRTNLATDPKVIKLCRAVSRAGLVVTCHTDEWGVANITRLVVIGALHAVWSAACDHARGGVLSTLTLAEVDDIVDIKGFGKALESVGWALQADDGVLLPNAIEFNQLAAGRITSGKSEAGGVAATASPSAMRKRAERERKRAATKGPESCDTAVTCHTADVTSHSDTDVTSHTENTTCHDKDININQDQEISPLTPLVTSHTENVTSHAVTPKPEAFIAKALIDRGISVQSCDPHLLSWVAAGLTVPHVLAALEIARKSNSDGRIKSGYLNSIITNPANKIMENTRVPIPAGFALTSETRQWAQAEGMTIDLDLETKKFINHALSRNVTSAAWECELKKWLLQAQGYQNENSTRTANEIAVSNAITNVHDMSWRNQRPDSSSREPDFREVIGEVRKSVPAHLPIGGSSGAGESRVE